MAKYEKFGPFLARQRAPEIKMAFAEIERVLGAPLPASAYKHRPWWSNNPSNNALTKTWLEAGYETTQVDMANRRLVFQRVIKAAPPAEPGQRIRQLLGSLKGLLQIEDGYDLSAPALPEWGRDLEAKYGAERHGNARR